MKQIQEIEDWEQLAECKSDTHYLEIDIDGGNGWIIPNGISREDNWRDCIYLTTHTFYEKDYLFSTKTLQTCGFRVKLKSWG